MSFLLSDVVDELKASLHASAGVFDAPDDADFKRHIDVARSAMGQKRPRSSWTDLTLVADTAEYDLPLANVLRIPSALWKEPPAGKPWDQKTIRAPIPQLLPGDRVQLAPVPEAATLARMGSVLRLLVFQDHVISASDPADTTLTDLDSHLLILRAQAEACRELMLRGLSKPVATRATRGNAMDPRGAFEMLIEEFEKHP